MQEYKSDRAIRTRDALVSAAFDLMLERPLEDIPIDDLVAAAGVGKGSFFNHFGDKNGLKQALAMQVRSEIEEQVTKANSQLTHPLERIAGGMREVTQYALIHRKRTFAMLRMTVGATSPDYSLNEGLRKDIEACVEAGFIAKGTEQSGLLYWLGLCTAIMTYVVESGCERDEAAGLLHQLLQMGLMGIGVGADTASDIARRCAESMLAQEPG